MMIAHKWLSITLPLILGVWGRSDPVEAEQQRWSRQVSNSEWIPLADPRTLRAQIPLDNAPDNLSPIIQSLTLPPALQQQYQEQLLQLQKTQESIQKLLLLQQQLKAQQQILQSQAYPPSSFRGHVGSATNKEGTHQSTIVNLENLPDLAPDPAALPGVNFLSQAHPSIEPSENPFKTVDNDQSTSKAVKDVDQSRLSNIERDRNADISGAERVEPKLESPNKQSNFHAGPKRPKAHYDGHLGAFVTPKTVYENQDQETDDEEEEEEEVQLVYVPAEALTQRNQPKHSRERKQYISRTHQRYQESRDNGNHAKGTSPPQEEAFARQLLLQLQKEQEERPEFLNSDRTKEIDGSNEPEKDFTGQSRLRQEAKEKEKTEPQREAAEAARNMKVLETLEESTRQKESERIRATRVKFRQEEMMDRIKLLELQAKKEEEEKEEDNRLAALERQKQLEIRDRLEQRKKLEKQLHMERQRQRQRQEQQQGLSLGRGEMEQQTYRQHLTETSQVAKGVKSRAHQRPRNRHESSAQATTTPSPNQPPLSVYMSTGANSLSKNLHVSDVLKALKDAKTIAVLDTIGPHSPRVFVGPANLESSPSYAKFDLPYLSSLDHNRVERKVDKLPFFVAPLSFEPPTGYSKIPFPAPHIGSVVVNTLDIVDEERPNAEKSDGHPRPRPLIEPNSYIDGPPSATTPTFNRQSAGTARYEPNPATAGLAAFRYRPKQFYGDVRSMPTGSTVNPYRDEQETTTSGPNSRQYYDDRATDLVPTTPSSQILRETVVLDKGEDGSPLGAIVASVKGKELATQLDLIDRNSPKERIVPARREQYLRRPNEASDDVAAFVEISLGDIAETRDLPGSTEYSLPAELPAISPHLPGLINSLLEGRGTDASPGLRTPEAVSTTVAAAVPTTDATIITTTTTQTPPPPPSTTYRPRGRQRGRISGARTTTSVTEHPTSAVTRSSSIVERSRRPYSRSRSRYTTTTEGYYRDHQSYEPTKTSILEGTTLKYGNLDHRRPSPRIPKFRMRDRSVEMTTRHSKVENQRTMSFDNDLSSSAVPRQTSESTKSDTNSKEQRDNVSDAALQDGARTSDDDGTRQSGDQRSYKTGNSFEYDAGNPAGASPQMEAKELLVPPVPMGYRFYKERPENEEDLKLAYVMQDESDAVTEERRPVSPTYNDHFEKIREDAHSLPPVFVPLRHEDQNGQSSPSTVSPLLQVTIQGTIPHESTTEAPLIVRQRVRSRNGGGRAQQESAIQSRTKGHRDDYVRLGAVNLSASVQRNRDGTKSRLRFRGQSHSSSLPQIQTEGEDHIRIQGNRKLTPSAAASATVTTATTTTTTTSPAPLTTYSQDDVEDDNDYGFIRPPNYRSAIPPNSGFHSSSVNYRPIMTLQGQHVYHNGEIPAESIPGEGETANQDYHHRRPKYQEAAAAHHHQPAIKLQNAEPNTMSANTANYPAQTTAQPKSRSDEEGRNSGGGGGGGKPRRGRGRRPGRKRITASTESSLDTNNEVPLDENYPRPIQTPMMSSESMTARQPLYTDNSDDHRSSEGSPNAALHLVRSPYSTHPHMTDDENYASEAFILNFGNVPREYTHRGEYSETGPISEPENYEHDAHGPRLETSAYNADIYGEESQWSTKLTRTSFQPSFLPNRLVKEEKDESQMSVGPDIITASPDTTADTVARSSVKHHHMGRLQSAIDGAGKTATPTFGRKMGRDDGSATETVDRRSETADKDGNIAQHRENAIAKKLSTFDLVTITSNASAQPSIKEDSSTEHSQPERGARKRRVRVRVRPIDDAFVSAESQHFNSALNGLIDNRYKYESIRENQLTTAVTPTGSSNANDMSTHEWHAETATEREEVIFRDFLEDLPKNDDESVVPARATSTITEIPADVWTTLTPFATIETVGTERSTLRDSPTETSATVNPENHEVVTTIKNETHEKKIVENGGSADDSSTEPQILHQFHNEAAAQDHRSAGKNIERQTEPPKSVPLPGGSSPRDHLGKFPRVMAIVGNDDAKNYGSSKSFEYDDLPKTDEHREFHPKNHRIEWSEVRYSSDRSVTTNDPEVTERRKSGKIENKTDADVQLLSGYVKAIFENMKDAEVATTSDTSILNDTRQTSESLRQADERRNNIDDSTLEVLTNVEDTGKAEEDARGDKNAKIPKATSENTTIDRVNNSSNDNIKVPMDGLLLSPEEPDVWPTTTTTTTVTTTKAIKSDSAISSGSGKVLRTSTTTKVSHMTEICYRGRCVMTKPKREVHAR